jgi:hypothetical protein
VASFKLSERDTGFFGPWRECRVDGVRVAFQGTAAEFCIEVGNFNADEEQLSDVYLSSTRIGRPKPKARVRHLDPFVGPQGQAIAERYYLNATCDGGYTQLKVPEVQAALQKLSDTVDEISIYESGGFSISCLGVTRHSVEADVDRAVAIVKALGLAAGPTPGARS